MAAGDHDAHAVVQAVVVDGGLQGVADVHAAGGSAARTAADEYLVLFFGGALVISVWENIPLSACLYETASAIGTVGLSLGITPGLGILSRCILITLMFFGRVGGITIIYAAVSENGKKLSKLPQEKITVG